MIGNAFILDNYTNIFDKALDYKQYFHYELNSKQKFFRISQQIILQEKLYHMYVHV